MKEGISEEPDYDAIAKKLLKMELGIQIKNMPIAHGILVE